jgi:hypothetical protein
MEVLEGGEKKYKEMGDEGNRQDTRKRRKKRLPLDLLGTALLESLTDRLPHRLC